jgi:exopolysaccharide biosynthesis operon protein EpsL
MGWHSPAAQAQAQLEPETFKLRIGENLQRDSNIFRLPAASGPVSDITATTSVGLQFNKAYSLQRLELDVGVDDLRYRNYASQNYTSLNYAGAWRWSLTPALHGSLTADRRQYQDRLADSSLGQLSRRTEKNHVFEAEYELGAAWRALAGAFDRSTTHSLALSLEPDVQVRGGQAGARYVLATGNSLAYLFRMGKGDYSGAVVASGLGNFSDREHELQVAWAPTGQTTIKGRLAYLDRSHDSQPARDFSGLTGQLNGTWTPTGKTSLTGGVARELGSYQTLQASYYEGYRLFAEPVWKMTEKTALRLRYEHGERRYRGPLPGELGSGRRDQLDWLQLALVWEPVRALKLVASAQRDQRRSSQVGVDYKAYVLGLSVQAGF